MLNSLYGAMGSAYFRYYDIRIAEAITLTGQLAIRFIMNAINKKLNTILKTEGIDYCILGDTDSCYFTLEKLVDKVCRDKTVSEQIDFMDKVCKQVLEPLIKETTMSLGKYLNALKPEALNMKRETLSDVAMVIRKKGYALSVWDSEGVRYKEPKLKVTGLELVRSSTPAPCRQSLRDVLKKVLYEDEAAVQKFVIDFREVYNTLSPDLISFPRGVNGMKQYKGEPVYAKGCPIHVRASLLFNHHMKRLSLDKIYTPIRDGDKIKFLMLKKPNVFSENVIGFPEILPKEFNLDKSVDYDLMFEKSFLDPLNIILEPLGWQSIKQSSLDDFFA